MIEEAREELEKIGSWGSGRPEVLRMKAVIYERGERWEQMKEVAGSLVMQWPEEAAHWIALGWAARRAGSIPEASDILRRSLELHPGEPVIHYNLACYEAQNGTLDEARRSLDAAIRLDPDMRERARVDPDLGVL